MGEANRRWLGFVSADVALDPTISGNAKAIYLVLAIHADNKTGTCYPSRSTLMEATGYSRSSVTRALEELVAHGVVKRTERFRDGRQTSNLYTLLDILAARRGDDGDTPGAHQ